MLLYLRESPFPHAAFVSLLIASPDSALSAPSLGKKFMATLFVSRRTCKRNSFKNDIESVHGFSRACTVGRKYKYAFRRSEYKVLSSGQKGEGTSMRRGRCCPSLVLAEEQTLQTEWEPRQAQARFAAVFFTRHLSSPVSLSHPPLIIFCHFLLLSCSPVYSLSFPICSFIQETIALQTVLRAHLVCLPTSTPVVLGLGGRYGVCVHACWAAVTVSLLFLPLSGVLVLGKLINITFLSVLFAFSLP